MIRFAVQSPRPDPCGFVVTNVDRQNELRRIRKRLGMTQKQLARLIGLAENSVARLERNEFKMKTTTDKLIRILTKMEMKKRQGKAK